MKRLDRDGYVLINNPCLVRKFSKQPYIRKLRHNGEFYIGHDRKKNMTILFKKPRLPF